MMLSLEKIPFHSALKRGVSRLSYTDSESRLIYIHIGKCGGVSLWDAIKNSDPIRREFSGITKIHTSKPPILRRARYLIVVRNPISRAMSAFNWRYKLVVEGEEQRSRFKGEYDVLLKYGTLNNISEDLYVAGKLNVSAARDFRKIHHLREDIHFYLGDLLDNVNSSQIYCVLATEALNSDVETLLRVSKISKTHENSNFVAPESKYMSEIAGDNLRKFLTNDYRDIERLLAMKNTTAAEKSILLR